MRAGTRPGFLLAGLWLASLGACTSFEQKVTFSESQTLGGKEVSADVLNEGREHYVHYCYACHGLDGDGKGPASRYLRPPPRDFRQGMYKFGGVVDGLPHDDDFVRIVRKGLHGTAMLPWDIADRELMPTIQYIKTFAEVWQEEEELGEQIPVDTDPWPGKETEAIARGEKIYHGFATCQQCHPAYLTLEEIYKASIEVGQGKAPITELRPNPYQPEVKPSDYTIDDMKVVFMPPDFLYNKVRSGSEVKDLYRVISAGIPGTAMTTWFKALPEADVWAVAYYVRSLIQLQSTPEALALRERLATQAEFVAPATPPPAPTPAAPAAPGAAPPSGTPTPPAPGATPSTPAAPGPASGAPPAKAGEAPPPKSGDSVPAQKPPGDQPAKPDSTKPSNP